MVKSNPSAEGLVVGRGSETQLQVGTKYILLLRALNVSMM